MQQSDREPLYKCIKTALEIKNRALSADAFELWWDILEDHNFDDVKSAIRQSVRSTQFAVDPSKIEEFLPDLLGHATPEIAWNLYPKYESDAGYVTDEIMQAGSVIDEISDKMARMAFLEAYKQIVANANMAHKTAIWWYSDCSTGTHDQRKESKILHTLEAMQCGRLTQQKAENTVRQLSNELGKSLKTYLPNLPEPVKKLTDKRQIETISKKIEVALKRISDDSSSTSGGRAERVRVLQDELDSYRERFPG